MRHLTVCTILTCMMLWGCKKHIPPGNCGTPAVGDTVYFDVEDKSGFCVPDYYSIRISADQFLGTWDRSIVKWSNGSTEYRVVIPGNSKITLYYNHINNPTDTFERTFDFTCGKSELYFPTSFSPGGDILNERWRPYGTGYCRMDLRIFDQHGNTMYTASSNDKDFGWPGTNPDQDHNRVDAGIYYYRCDVLYADGESKVFTGEIFVMR